MSKKRNTGISLGGLIFILAIVAIVYLFPAKKPASVSTALPTTQSQLSSPPPGNGVQSSNLTASWLQVFFTNPNPPDNVGNGIDQGVVTDVNNAKSSIDITSFDLNLPSFVNALVAASQQGVQVRVVVDGVNGSQTLSAKLAGTSKDFDATQTLQCRNHGGQWRAQFRFNARQDHHH